MDTQHKAGHDAVLMRRTAPLFERTAAQVSSFFNVKLPKEQLDYGQTTISNLSDSLFMSSLDDGIGEWQ